MIFQLKQFKRRCRYYFGYMYSVLFYVAPSLLAADLFEQGEDYIAFLMLGTGYLMSIFFLLPVVKTKNTTMKFVMNLRDFMQN